MSSGNLLRVKAVSWMICLTCQSSVPIAIVGGSDGLPPRGTGDREGLTSLYVEG